MHGQGPVHRCWKIESNPGGEIITLLANNRSLYLCAIIIIIINDFQQPSISSKYQVSYTSIYRIVSYLKPLPSSSFFKFYYK